MTTSETLTRPRQVCTSNLQGFEGCEKVPGERAASCPACYAEYLRRSRAMRDKQQQEQQELLTILGGMKSLTWDNRPKVRVTFQGMFGQVAKEGKIDGTDSFFLLLKQRNSRRGPIVTYTHTPGDSVKIEIKGKTEWVAAWESSTQFSTYSLAAKDLADSVSSAA